MNDLADMIGGVDFTTAISKPLMEITKGQAVASRLTLDLIKQLGLTEGNEVITTAFGVKVSNGDTVLEATMEIPNLALIHLPCLVIDEVDIDFTFEVRSTTESDNSLTSSNWSGSSKGAPSSSFRTTRKTDNSSKYHVNINARDMGPSEGLSRMLDGLTKLIPENLPTLTEDDVNDEEGEVEDEEIDMDVGDVDV
eukprot:TRINITY_DN1012_c0_g1_i1.p1 TRINITY_DN1012_c0_g1~~TRINITY_DN1012_c0_g1_i1.p1  ORF type:complete len:204 (+),score=51.67 TRINITY_DN1012_c0_g1_i1:28-612(+)